VRTAAKVCSAAASAAQQLRTTLVPFFDFLVNGTCR
jgi:hypothetical protein